MKLDLAHTVLGQFMLQFQLDFSFNNMSFLTYTGCVAIRNVAMYL